MGRKAFLFASGGEIHLQHSLRTWASHQHQNTPLTELIPPGITNLRTAAGQLQRRKVETERLREGTRSMASAYRFQRWVNDLGCTKRPSSRDLFVGGPFGRQSDST